MTGLLSRIGETRNALFLLFYLMLPASAIAHGWNELAPPEITLKRAEKIIMAAVDLQSTVDVRNFEGVDARDWQLWLETALGLSDRSRRSEASKILAKHGLSEQFAISKWQEHLSYLARVHDAKMAKAWEIDHHALNAELELLSEKDQARRDEILELFDVLSIGKDDVTRFSSVLKVIGELIHKARP